MIKHYTRYLVANHRAAPDGATADLRRQQQAKSDLIVLTDGGNVVVSAGESETLNICEGVANDLSAESGVTITPASD